MTTGQQFDFNKEDRKRLWHLVTDLLEKYYQNTSELPVSPSLDIKEIKSVTDKFDFSMPLKDEEAVKHVIHGLTSYIVHTPHPSYYGLFNPRATFPGILADVITAVFNPQMAAWSHSPFATEVENYCIRKLGEKFGYRTRNIDGTFCTGGAEANLTSVLCALNHHFPDYANAGLRGLKAQPLMYCSAEAHHSVARAGRVAGLGFDAVRTIPADNKQQLIPEILKDQIHADKKNGFAPFMIIANAGSTGTGAMDPLREIAEIAKENDLWFHVDAAYGGAMIVEPSMKHLLAGAEQSDSITIDIHKWFSAPMATSMFITSHRSILSQTFRITADYMPKEAKGMDVEDPFTHSIQWSRRFIGLKFYLSLLMFGWNGLAEMIRSTTRVGNYLKNVLSENNWQIINDTVLPIVCFTDREFKDDKSFVFEICNQVVDSGKAWVSTYKAGDTDTLRACITNYRSGEREINELVDILGDLRSKYKR